MRDEELFPADLMCLHSELPENVCYIKTTNLDGETNLKIRKPLDLKGLPVGARGKGRAGEAGPGALCGPGGVEHTLHEQAPAEPGCCVPGVTP